MSNSPTFFEAQQWAFSFVKQKNCATSGVDMLLTGEMSFSTTEFLLHLRQPMSKEHWQHFENNVKLYCQGWPPQYLLGYAYFYGLKFKVTQATLIPRLETEELVDWALADNDQVSKKIADIGTGTGAIGLTLKMQRPNWQVTLTDISGAALAVAKENAQTLKQKVSLKQGDLLAALPENFYDIIICNPPYISEGELDVMDRSVVKYEPHLALFAKENGLAIYRQLAKQITSYVHAGSKLYLEIGYLQGPAVMMIFKTAFPNAEVTLKRDITAHDRMIRVIFN